MLHTQFQRVTYLNQELQKPAQRFMQWVQEIHIVFQLIEKKDSFIGVMWVRMPETTNLMKKDLVDMMN